MRRLACSLAALMATASVASAAQAPVPACDRLSARPGALLDLDGAPAWDQLESDASASICGTFLRHWRPSASQMADAIYQTGIAAFRDNDLDRAIQFFTAALEVRDLRPDHLAFLYSERGRAHNEKGEFGRAIDDFTASLRHAPQDTGTLYRRGIAYWNAGRYERSVADFTRAIHLDPEDATLYRERGDAYRAMDQLDHAMEDFNRVLKSDPDDAAAYRYRGAAHAREGKHDLAIADYTAAIRLDPEEAAAYLDRGLIYLEGSQYRLAVDDYSAALRIDPDDARTYNSRCLANTELGLYDQAIADCGRAIDLGLTNLHRAYNNRARAYLEKGLFDGAIRDYTMALELQPDYAAAHYGRGRAFEATGETSRARQDYKEAHRLAPHDLDYRAAHLAAGPVPLISVAALAFIGAGAFGALGYRKRRRRFFTWTLMLAGLGLSIGAFAFYS